MLWAADANGVELGRTGLRERGVVGAGAVGRLLERAELKGLWAAGANEEVLGAGLEILDICGELGTDFGESDAVDSVVRILVKIGFRKIDFVGTTGESTTGEFGVYEDFGDEGGVKTGLGTAGGVGGSFIGQVLRRTELRGLCVCCFVGLELGKTGLALCGCELVPCSSGIGLRMGIAIAGTLSCGDEFDFLLTRPQSLPIV